MKPFGLNPLKAATAVLAVSSNLLKAHAAPVKSNVKHVIVPRAQALGQRDINWATVDYSGVDWNTVVNWKTVDYGQPTPTPPPAPAPTTQSAQPVPPAPTTLVTWVAPPPAPTTSQQPAPVPTTSAQPAPAPTNGFSSGGLNPNAYSITVINAGTSEFNVAFFENEAPYQPSFSVTSQSQLQPGQNVTLTVAEGWAGRAQKLLGAPGDPATWGEIAFVGGTWYDVSYIRGNNGPVVITTPNNGGVAGTSQNLYPGAPAESKITDSAGNAVLDATESYTGTVDQPLVDYYRANNNGNGYARNFDNGAVREGTGTNVVVEIY